ncbi:MAG: glycosyltransferase family 4 protein, partial [Candidatus Omnitrophica bacterium]|nr:glycosyltransferase family 4 protein [Candidatus Omnitrophota bacterium]
EEKKFNGKLVIAGMKGWKSESFDKNLKKFGIHNDVVVLGFLKNEELRHFYATCEVFVFPSFYEGFGFPIIEAFNCGAAVITSNVSSCPELAGDAALTVDPNDIQQMTDSIITVLNDEKLREDLRARGLQRAEEFSFQRTAEETLRVYEEVYSGC